MESQIARDVVNEAQSMGGSPIDATGVTQKSSFAEEGGRSAHEVERSGLVEKDPRDENDIASYTPTIDGSNLYSTPLVNGETGSYNGSEDAGYQNSTAGDQNFGSDTEQSKSENADSTFPKRERSNSVRKPAAFKPVSVTKNFLAKSGASGMGVTRLSVDKGPSVIGNTMSSLQASRPRLVAKSGRDALLSKRGSGEGSASPDPSKVWNRNRPVPPAPPKKLTDEELKQQYGIHLATRLQTDEAGKESKWADIDDDEDDWAPETVEWMDGTKSTILPGEQLAAPLESKVTLMERSSSEEARNDEESPQPAKSLASAGKTILRPSLSARNIPQTKPGLVLRSLPENSLQSEKPKASSASKSPWAPLPPVDKASPVTFVPSYQDSQAPSLSRRESITQDSNILAPSPAKEIAADDFDRSWRDTEKSSRELFDSRSGRYEPVRNFRRSSKQESTFRAPAVLQRPSASAQSSHSDMTRHREESATRPWTRRLEKDDVGPLPTSSDVKHVSHNEEAAPIQSDSSLSPSFVKEELATSPNLSSTTPSREHNIAKYSARGSDRNDPSPEAGTEVVTQDNYEQQRELMRKKIEENRKRKQDEEAREEAERKERIRLKIEALDRASGQETLQEHKVEDISSRVGQKATPAPTTPNDLVQAKDIQERSLLKTDSQEESLATKSNQLKGLGRPPESPQSPANPLPPQRKQLTPPKSPKLTSQTSAKSLSDTDISAKQAREIDELPGLGRPVSQEKPIEKPAKLWNQSLPGTTEAAPVWHSVLSHQTNRNVWAPPVNIDRALGNGAFERDYQRIPSIQFPHHANQRSSPVATGPIRPPSGSPRLPLESSHASTSPPPLMNRSESQTQVPPTFPPSVGSSRGPMPQVHLGAATSYQMGQPPSNADALRRAWQGFPGLLIQQEKEEEQKLEADRKAEEERHGPRAGPSYTIKAKFKKTSAPDELNPRGQVVSTTTTSFQRSDEGYNVVQPAQSANLQANAAPSHQPAGNGKPSRFFPPGSDRSLAVAQEQPHSLTKQSSAQELQPPPETSEHPAHGRVASHPLVHLPGPPVKVKLPPTPSQQAVTADPPAMMPQKFRSGPQPIVNQVAWQDRFNGLFGRAPRQVQPPSPISATHSATTSQVPSSPIVSDSKAVFDSTPALDKASVSLGYRFTGSATDPPMSLLEYSVETKVSEEELLEDRAFGDAPRVHLLMTTHPNTQVLQPTPPSTIVYSQVQLERAPSFHSTRPSAAVDQLFTAPIIESGTPINVRLLGQPLKVKVQPSTNATATHPYDSKPSTQPKRRFGSKRDSNTSSPSTEEGRLHLSSKSVEKLEESPRGGRNFKTNRSPRSPSFRNDAKADDGKQPHPRSPLPTVRPFNPRAYGLDRRLRSWDNMKAE